MKYIARVRIQKAAILRLLTFGTLVHFSFGMKYISETSLPLLYSPVNQTPETIILWF